MTPHSHPDTEIEQLRQQVRDLSLIQDIASELPSPPILSDTVAAIGRIVRKAMPDVDLALFFLHHAASEALALVGGDWDPALHFDTRALTVGVSEKGALSAAFNEGRTLFYERKSTEAHWKSDEVKRVFDPQSLLYIPLAVEHGSIGVLALVSTQAHGIQADSRRLASVMANPSALAVERSRLYEKLRAANEKLEQINKLKNEFISMVSHELRTPLTTIKGFVSIVLNEETGPLNDQQRHFLQTSDRAIDRLTLLVSDLLDISRIEAGQIKMQLRPMNLRDLFNRTASSFAPQFKAQSLVLTIQTSDAIPPVLADPDRIGQVLDNLLSNALKFTTTGGITISTMDKGDFILVSVKDTGIGIPMSEQDKIFDKFYQIKVGSGWPSKGTGLGLAIVHSIIESHRGKVWVESEPGQGADFRFMLPRARLEAETVPQAARTHHP